MPARPRLAALVTLGLLGLGAACRPGPSTGPEPSGDHEHGATAWQAWSPAAFDRAAAEDRLILINVVASWCHWCHVMDEETYDDPEVAALLAERFVVIRVDSDARPDIADRYQAWGWPATAILSPAAEPVVNLRGFQAPEEFAGLLRELLAEHERGQLRQREAREPGPPPSAAALADIRAKAAAQLDAYFDDQDWGWGDTQKYPWPGPIEYALLRARLDPSQAIWREHALATLGAAQALIDPVWGGMYQYSLKGRWDQPHFEKIAMIQAGAIENYAHAAMITGDGTWLAAGTRVADYVLTMLQDPGGGFYTSQDADLRPERDGAKALVGADYYALDDAARRELGIPRIDRSIYADLNGQLIHALTELYRASQDPAHLVAAEAAASRILAEHRDARGRAAKLERGGLSHGSEPAPGELRYLADQAAMAWGLLGLHRVTGEHRWLEAAEALATYMVEDLADGRGGLHAHSEDPDAVGVFAERRSPLQENALAAQVFVELHMILDGDGSIESPWLERARAALLAVGNDQQVRGAGKVVGRYLFALALLDAIKYDFSVVAEPGDPAADALYRAALAIYEPRACFERSLPGERYPDIGKAVLYLCSDRACSQPLDDPAAVPSSAASFLLE